MTSPIGPTPTPLPEPTTKNINEATAEVSSQTGEAPPIQPASEITKVKPKWEIRGLQDAYKDAESPPWVIKDLVMSKTLTLVSAHPHGMKSLSWLYACMEGVHTGKVFGHFDANLNNVLFIETEDPEWVVKKRVQGFAKGLNLPESEKLPGFHFTCPGPFELIKQEKELERLIEEYKLDLIVLSTLQNLLGDRNWKEQGEMADLMAMLVRLARKCPIVLLTHSPQDRTQKRAIGTITLGANCATHIHSEKSLKGDGTFVHLKVDSKAGAEDTDFSLMLHTDRKDKDPIGSVRGLVFAGKGNRGKTKEQRVIEAMDANHEASVKEIAQTAECDESYVRRVQKKLKGEEAQEENNKAA